MNGKKTHTHTHTHTLLYGTLEFRVQVHTHVPWYFGASYFRTKLLVTTQTRFISVLRAHGYSSYTVYIEPEDTMSFYDTQFHDESSWVSSKNVTMCLISKGLALCGMRVLFD